jgi:5'-deoxynucleotidase YfbR-like HD superfamily hydrolase
MQTVSGRLFWPLDPRPGEVYINDIAHALSNLCRFGGMSSRFYSVAEHSWRVSLACDKKDTLAGLLHDATEAYLVDVPRPIKVHLSNYKEIELRLACVIGERFGLDLANLPASVKHADEVLLATEQRDLMKPPPVPWETMPDPLPERIVPMMPSMAKRWLLKRFEELSHTHEMESL